MSRCKKKSLTPRTGLLRWRLHASPSSITCWPHRLTWSASSVTRSPATMISAKRTGNSSSDLHVLSFSPSAFHTGQSKCCDNHKFHGRLELLLDQILNKFFAKNQILMIKFRARSSEGPLCVIDQLYLPQDFAEQHETHLLQRHRAPQEPGPVHLWRLAWRHHWALKVSTSHRYRRLSLRLSVRTNTSQWWVFIKSYFFCPNNNFLY